MTVPAGAEATEAAGAHSGWPGQPAWASAPYVGWSDTYARMRPACQSYLIRVRRQRPVFPEMRATILDFPSVSGGHYRIRSAAPG